MRLYEGSISDFRADVIHNLLADKLAARFQNYYRRSVGESEHRSWQQSLNYLSNSFEASDLSENRLVIEYELPYSSRRIDVLLFGQNAQDRESIVLLELKQWSNDNVTDASADGNVVVDYGRSSREVPHPSWQVEGYHFDLQNFLSIFEDKAPPELNSCSFCHNYARLKDPRVLFQPKFKEGLSKYPIFAKEDVVALGNYLRERLAKGSGLEVFNRFVNSPIRPSKRLVEHTREMINKQQVFTLIDDQIAAFHAIRHRVKALAHSNQKSIVIVRGGPGTGKSVIALEVMGELLRQRKKVMHVTGSSAFTNTLRKLVGARAKALFKFFDSFVDAPPDSFDVLIADEAHRIRATSSRGWPRPRRSEVPQIDELLKVARLTIFFIDEHQIVRPREVGSVQLIRDGASKNGIADTAIAEFELHTQFRCSGSDSYLQWLDHVLELRTAEAPRFDPRMEVRIFDDPRVMHDEIRARNSEKNNSARIAAGFCWKWSKPLPDGSLVNDVKIGDFEMPWENKKEFWKWATEDEGMEQVGTVYTAQGFEFDYIGVIFGKDLVYDHDLQAWKAQPEHSHDKEVVRANPKMTEHLKCVYRVLMSRAHKGVYIHFVDEGTRRYFEAQLGAHLRIDKRAGVDDAVGLEIVPDVPVTDRFRTYLPVYSLAAAAGGFSDSQEVRPLGWARVSIGRKLTDTMFIAQVKGRSMEPVITDGSFCIFQIDRGGSRNGKVVLVQSRHVDDAESGGQYTVKRYFSEIEHRDDGTWRHKRITLVPDNRDFKEIVLENVDPETFKVIAEFVSCLKD